MLIPWSEQADPTKYSDLDSTSNHRSLVEELQSHKPLRHLPLAQKPQLIGGLKPSSLESQSSILHLHAMEDALNQLRVHCDQFMQVRERVVANDAFTVRCLGELKQWVRERERMEKDGEYHWDRPLLKSQMDRAMQTRPGWLDLQDEVTKGDAKLSPVEVEGFYVIRK